ncbi:bifunctional demethylmenaquinone methyltransferase/2-methoxy-6-polyprenyl-1,4-benzoquinol methylase UbiE [Synechococcus elongatus]|uniref:2-phytyl-1,4-naphtoquinone methyltransferase n=2 Tax=Synechococcus elongatus TaxID=32046 RepID=MENG_SYNE7|nr:bifunctional demethylmenaquinone methyltransferase/2-methoxy-6-polyprenyl-1,4-benzoquinol methylase UbiE [Synechococcus elongatus]Q31P90.1 RecName: Full=2-phytyl-1,4-naphtoquinone methyltransferase; AltName: Full=Demethylphylloquinone methyltransferase [Synechococcus elongatus PCC 7942 = FACHB-805]Q5N4X9.1 RecName: Full=2-phytyl-1,4-naphtoquinone methyltransferase; AltName: Full=Demethylphylloquinone methyltransferase [Synechococcus elongatus PCC 6301]ABB57129.1 demethylmenaquinone methyltran
MSVLAPDAVEGLFDQIAPIYDNLNDQLSFGLHRLWKRMAVKWSAAKPGDRVLDLCCGSGDLAFLLAKVVGSKGQVIGFDRSQALLSVAGDRARQLASALVIDWQRGDALDLPFPDDHFDAATLGYGLRNVPDIPTVLRQLQRVLKPGARAAILDMHRPYSPLLRQFQQVYLDRWVVPAAAAQNCAAEYEYIDASLEAFPQGQQQVALAIAAGFQRAKHYELAAGLMGVLVVEA